MSFLAPGELDRVWVLQYIDYSDFQIIGIYTTEEAAIEAKATMVVRNPSDVYRRNSNFVIDEIMLDSDLLAHYWWEPQNEA